MVQRSSGAVTRGVPNQVQKKGGVCYRHRTKSQWYQHTPNNIMRKPNAVTPVIPAPPHQSINYEEEEEL